MYYHVRMFYYVQKQPPKISHVDRFNLQWSYMTKEILEPYKDKKPILFKGKTYSTEKIADIKISQTPREISDVTLLYNSDFPFSGTDISNDVLKKFGTALSASRKTKPLSKNVFIVHGTDHKPMKELKTILKDVGLNPIVLHEQPSRGSTVIEKLEKHSDVSFAFVILTPDDGLFNLQQLVDLSKEVESKRLRRDLEDKLFIDEFLKIITNVSRQNVILEFGYFVGLLGRHNVCCLCTGDLTVPSDMLGIVYVPFKESVYEAREMILKELREAGYVLGS
jgi:predicted nucleotide-binding protein